MVWKVSVLFKSLKNTHKSTLRALLTESMQAKNQALNADFIFVHTKDPLSINLGYNPSFSLFSLT